MSDAYILSLLDTLLPEKQDQIPENWRSIVHAWHQATHDDLTGVWNRKYFEERCAEKLSSVPGSYIIVCSDISDFKLINELFGRDKASELLCIEADLLKSWPDPDMLYGKIADDRFAMLIRRDKFQPDIMTQCTARLQAALGSAMYRIKVSYGIYQVTDTTESVASMCDKALLALKSIHESLEQCVAFYKPEMLAHALHEKTLAGTFEEALKKGEFQIYLQPQVDVSGQFLGAEALVRWIHSDQSVTPPCDFIPLFERTGLIHRLDTAVWELAAKKLSDWHRRGYTNCHISVNISAKDFFYIDIYRHFLELTERYQIPPAKLNLEITESTLTQDVPDLQHQLLRLQKAGFLLEIDDFGSGYSSLNMLKDIYADILKIDMGFLRETENRHRSLVILRAIINMAHALNMPVITEGVETADQVDFLKKMGCDAFQGYYFSAPLPVAAFEQKYLVPLEQTERRSCI